MTSDKSKHMGGYANRILIRVYSFSTSRHGEIGGGGGRTFWEMTEDSDTRCVFLHGLNDQQATIYVRTSDKASVIFTCVQEKFGVPIEYQRLVYGSSDLKPDGTIESFGISKEANVWLLLRLSGGTEKSPATLQCIGCGQQVRPEESGLACAQSHVMCTRNNCAKLFVENIVLTTTAPPACPQCHIDYPFDKVYDMTKCLPADKVEAAKKLLLKRVEARELLPGEFRVSCPRPGCDYTEIHKKTDGVDYIVCGVCRQRTCVYCNRDPSQDHSLCAKYGSAKLAIEEAISEGSCRRCPKCRKRGQKNESCVHITCHCGHQFCYVCLKDTAQIGGDWGAHRNGTTTDRNRCPSPLQVIPGHGGDEPNAVTIFHQRLIKAYIQDAFTKYPAIGMEAFTHYRLAEKHGISLADLAAKVELLPQVKVTYCP